MLITWFINNISISAITIINYISMVIAISAFVIASSSSPLETFSVRSFRMIRIRISDRRSLGSWQIKRTDESTLDKNSSVHLI